MTVRGYDSCMHGAVGAGRDTGDTPGKWKLSVKNNTLRSFDKSQVGMELGAGEGIERPP